MFVDSHCHLYVTQDLDGIVKRARENNVGIILNNACDYNESKESLDIGEKFDEVLLNFGLHPGNLLKMSQIEITEFFVFLEGELDRKNRRFIGLGEIGLDYFYAKSEAEKKKQEEIMEKFLKISSEEKLPVTLHSRRAERKALELGEKFEYGVLLHWFTHSKKMCKMAVDYGMYISAGPSIVRNEQIMDVVRTIPLENLMFETDSPVPYNGINAEPFWIKEVMEFYCSEMELEMKDVEKQVEKNVKKCFGI